MTTATKLREDLIENVYEALKKDTIPHKRAKEMNNAVGKALALAKAVHQYQLDRKEKPHVPFFE